MAKLDDLIQQKQQRDEDWKAKKTAEREELGQLSDDAVMRVTSEPGAYLHYLDILYHCDRDGVYLYIDAVSGQLADAIGKNEG